MFSKRKEISAKLNDQFNAVARCGADTSKNRWISVNKDLYDTYLKLYFRSLQLVDKLDCILKDGEHQLCMEEGLKDGWHLPQPDFMADDVAQLKSFMKELDPFYAIPMKNSDNVRVSAKLAVQMHHLLQIDILMVGKLFDMFRHTEYLNYHRELKSKGIKYAGPTSLGEIVNTYMMMAHTHNKTEKYLQQRNIPSDWHKKVLA
jgi:hypothetical protein